MRAIPVGLGTNGWRLRQPLFPRIAHGVGEGFSNPAAEFLKLLTHCSYLTFSLQSQGNVRVCQRVEIPVSRTASSATAAALLGLALVLLDGRFVVTQTLEISEDTGLGDLALEATQG